MTKYNTQHTSAGVYFQERDRSAVAALAIGGVATLVMPGPRGQVGKNVRIYADELDEMIGGPTGKYWQNVEIIRLLAQQARYINYTRVGADVKHAITMLTTFKNFATTREVPAGLDNLDTILFNSQDIMAVVAKDGGDNGNKYFVAFEPDTTDPEGEAFNLYLFEVGFRSPIRSWTGATLRYKTDDDNNQLFIEERVNNDRTCPVMVFVNPTHFKLKDDPAYPAVNAAGGGPRDPNAMNAPHGQLLHGDDGAEIDIYHADEDIRNRSLSLVMEGWENYRDWETIDLGIACDGGLSHPAIAALLDEIVADRQDSISSNNVPVKWQEYANAIAYRRGRLELDGMGWNLSSSYTALNTNDIEYFSEAMARYMWMPCSVAQTYAMLECDKSFGWLAPAGLNRGGLPWGTRLRVPNDLDFRDALNDNQINFPIHFKNPSEPNDPVGIYMWNADTTNGTNSALDDIGVRRLLAILTRSSRSSFLRYNFQNDSTLLRTNLRRELTDDILQPVQNNRGLEWFEVIVDMRNNTDASSANGDLFVDIFLDPTRYTKRIHLNLNVASTGQVKAVVSLIERGQV